MEELVSVMEEIRDQLVLMNSKLDMISMDIDAIKGVGLNNSISDVYDKMEEIIGTGLYNSLSDVCDKLDNVETAIDLK